MDPASSADPLVHSDKYESIPTQQIPEVTDAYYALLHRSNARDAGSENPTTHAAASELPESPVPGSWDLPQTLRQDFDHHEPMTFPELSSTVPDNTMDREMLLQTVSGDQNASAINFQVLADIADGTTSSSIPWSAYLATPTLKSDGAQSVNPALSPLKYLIPMDQKSQDSDKDREVTMEATTQVQSNTPRGSPLDTAIQKGVVRDDSTPEKGSVSKKRSREPDTPADELAVEVPSEMYKPRPSRSRAQVVPDLDIAQFPEERRRTKRRKTATDSTVADGAESASPSAAKVGVITEMGFSPTLAKKALRQSFGNMGEAVDLLVSKEISDVNDTKEPTKAAAVETDQSDTELLDVRPRKSRVEKTFNRKLSHIRVTPPSELRADLEDPLVADDCTHEDQKGREKDDENTMSNETDANLTNSTRRDRNKLRPAKCKVSKNHTTDRSHHIEAVTNDGPELENEQAEPIPQPKQTQAKKRGRGRPRKQQELAPQEAATHNKADEPTETGRDAQQITADDEDGAADSRTPKDPLQATDQHSAILNTAGPDTANDQTTKSACANNEENVPLEGSGIMHEPAKKQASIDGITNAATTHTPSPVPKGKVPHRVGLSKKVRIAPLLRVVKK